MVGQQLGGELSLAEHIWDISKHFSWKSDNSVWKSLHFKIRKYILVSYGVFFIIAYIFSMMRTGFLVANTCVYKKPIYLKRDQQNYIRGKTKWINEWTLFRCCCVKFEQVFNHRF